MRWLRAVLRHIFVWWVPGLVMVLVLLVALVFWVLGTQQGTRMVLHGAAQMLDGEVQDVRGSLWHGLDISRLKLAFGGTDIDLTALSLDVDWRALRERRLHVRELSVGSAKVALTTTEPEPDDTEPEAPLTEISLPVTVVVDRLAVGGFSLTQDGQPLPAAIHDLVANLAADQNGARLNIVSLQADHEWGRASLAGGAVLRQLADPWPLDANIEVSGWGQGEGSPLCVNAWMAVNGLASVLGTTQANPNDCPVSVALQAHGSLDALEATLSARGGVLGVDATASLTPRDTFPLRTAQVTLQNEAHKVLVATVDRQAAEGKPSVDRIQARIKADQFDLGGVLGPDMPSGVITAQAALDAEIENLQTLHRASVDVSFDKGSRWNKQPLAGKLAGRLAVDPPAQDAQATPPLPGLPAGWRVDMLDVDLSLGKNRVQAQGKLGAEAGELALDAKAPQLNAFWPDLPGGATLKAVISGALARHSATLDASYTPDKPNKGQLGRAPMRASLALEGGWGKQSAPTGQAAQDGWRGTFSKLQADTAGFVLRFTKPVALTALPSAQAPQWQAEIGATTLALGFPNKEQLVVQHGGSRVGGERWETAGRSDNLVITASMVRQIMQALDPQAAAKAQKEARQANKGMSDNLRRVALDLSWDLRFANALAGQARLAWRDGDLRIPGDPPVPLGLQRLALDLKATPSQGANSRLDLTLDAATQKMGTAHVRADTVLSGLTLPPKQAIRATVNADITDLAWTGMFTGDSLDIGGKVKANIQAQGSLAGAWSTSGTVQGDSLRVVRVDDGVRLLDGTLRARLDGDTVYLDSLRFPAVLRVIPDEARTRDWLNTDAAKNGYLEASGSWQISQSHGQVGVTLHRYPVLQRSDRFAMLSGKINLDAALPNLSITGKLQADAGWISVEMLQSVPSLDGDVRVIRAGEDQAASAPTQINMALDFDMGQRFYVTGMGLSTGVVGNLRVLMADGQIRGVGALRTRGGGIEAYGQKLSLRRGTITFQGRIDNPLLDIEALRTGDQVEAGVRVSGTVQRMRIDLISYPDVSDVEKLSWLVLGRGPDEGGGDTALLMSVGTALLGGGEPFYRQFGLDDVSIRSGAIGSSGSLLPDRTVATNATSVSDELSTQFLVASKRFTNGITLSVEQALAGSETVGRLSYRLARGLSADLKGGGVNGLALVYRVLIP